MPLASVLPKKPRNINRGVRLGACKLLACPTLAGRQKLSEQATAETNRAERTIRMRLICPNCGAQYEVPDDVIPAGGRDVQCSNCGFTWFERPGACFSEEEGIAAPKESEALVSRAQDAEEFADSDDDDLWVPPPARERKPLSRSVAHILKEEAAREEAQRREEAAAGIQSQPDLGIDDEPDQETQRVEEVRRRMARLKGEMAPLPSKAGGGSRSDLLPDIEDFNSSLRSADERRSDEPEAIEKQEKGQRSGFRLGFSLILLVAILALIVYNLAPRLAEAVPSAAPILSDYVDMVNDLRLWVDLRMQDLIAMMKDKAGS